MVAAKAKIPTRDAKERLLDAAICVFARYGFEAASTRMLVREAGVNISAIPYYFGGKDGLYEAVIRQIISIGLSELGPQAEKLRTALARDDLSEAEARQLLHAFITAIAGFLLSGRATLHMAQIIIREQMQPSPVFNILYENMMQPMHHTVTRLIAFLLGVDATTQDAILCTHTVLGQLLIFKTHKEFVLRSSGWTGYGEEETAAIVSRIIRNTDAIIAAHKGYQS
tara:strand:- start:6257 stop:6934 length:678 start_codon:yes stop_codon:yes gene_type:complete